MKRVQIREPRPVAVVWRDDLTYEGTYTVSDGVMTVVSRHGRDVGPVKDESVAEERAKMLMREIAYVASGDRDRAIAARFSEISDPGGEA